MSELATVQEATKSFTQFRVTKADADLQQVEGIVYEPNVIDTHGEMMLPEDVELAAHRFLARLMNHNIDVMHNNRLVLATVIESFIARPGDPEYPEGAWVVKLLIADDMLWSSIKAGDFSGYSIEMMIYKVPVIAEYEVLGSQMGITEVNDGHDHAFFVKVDDDGRVISGETSIDDGHKHEILYGTATETTNGHSHRFFLA